MMRSIGALVAALTAWAPAVALAGELVVSSFSSHSVLRYDGTTGDLIDIFVPTQSGGLLFPGGAAIGADGNLYVTSTDPFLSDFGRDPNVPDGRVLRYDGATGAFIDEFVPLLPLGSGGLRNPTQLVFGPDGHLYVATSGNDNSVIRFHGTSGAFIDTFVPQGSGGLRAPFGLAFGLDGHLYVTSGLTDTVLRYDGQTGAFLGVFVPLASGGLRVPVGLTFGPDGNLYVAGASSGTVVRYDGTTGAFVDVFVPFGSGGLSVPHIVAFGPDTDLYVTSTFGDSVLRYDGTTGAFLETFVAPGSGGLDRPSSLVFTGRGLPHPGVNEPPVAAAGPDVDVPAGATCVGVTRLDGRGSTDPDGDPLTFVWTGPFGTVAGPRPAVSLPLGVHTITLTVSDGHGGTASDTVTVAIVDATPPAVTLEASPAVLSPPNHQFVPVAIMTSIVDNCDPDARCVITQVTSNEPEDGLGDGDTGPDWVITGALALQLRAERSGTGPGRTYTIVVTCTDVFGNSTSRTVEVTVRH